MELEKIIETFIKAHNEFIIKDYYRNSITTGQNESWIKKWLKNREESVDQDNLQRGTRLIEKCPEDQ